VYLIKRVTINENRPPIAPATGARPPVNGPIFNFTFHGNITGNVTLHAAQQTSTHTTTQE